MREPCKLFIIEGESREDRIIEKMTRCFMKGSYKARVLHLPAAQNIYMLYSLLEQDDFESDLVELLRDRVESARVLLDGISRDEIDEIYLFFDYDIHQNNVPPEKAQALLQKMLEKFDNETENGRLYISYPMVEALYDMKDGFCEAFSDCYIPLSTVGDFKRLAGEQNPLAGRQQDILFWKSVLNSFYLRLTCLFDCESIDFPTYSRIDPGTIYEKERALTELQKQVFVLSAFPEFLFDYFKVDFWESMTHQKKRRFSHCPHQKP